MKKSEKLLGILERRAAKAARGAEITMDTHHFTVKYHPLFAFSAAPWCVIIFAVAVLCHTVLSVLWLSILCYGIGAFLLYLMLDWFSFRAEVEGAELTVTTFGVAKRRFFLRDITAVRLSGEKHTDAKRMEITFGNKKLVFVSEMIGFELLFEWTKQR